MKYIKTFEQFINEAYKGVNESKSFDDVYKAAKKVKGFKGSKKGFEVPYKYGTVDMYPSGDRVDITWTSGGSTQDSDTYEISKALTIISGLNENIISESIDSKKRAKIVVLLKKSGFINTEDYTYSTGMFLANDIETANDMTDAIGDKYRVAIHDDKITKDGKVPMMIV
jgi:hypothetical protein